MNILEKYSVYNMCKTYHENKSLVDAYIQNKSIEGYEDVKLLGVGIAIFVIFLLLGLVIWIWAIVILIKNWNVMPDWAKILGVIFVTPIMPIPIATLLIAYLAKK